MKLFVSDFTERRFYVRMQATRVTDCIPPDTESFTGSFRAVRRTVRGYLRNFNIPPNLALFGMTKTPSGMFEQEIIGDAWAVLIRLKVVGKE